jgi:hypothetical protein
MAEPEPTHGGSDVASLLMALSARALGAGNEPTNLHPPAPYGSGGTSAHGFGARPLETMQALLPQDRALSKEIAFQLLTQGP